jgi:hypothetical protein
MNPRSHAHLIFDKGARNIQWRKDSLFNKYSLQKWLSACRKLKLSPCLSPLLVSIQSELRPEILKLVQERAGNTLEA